MTCFWEEKQKNLEMNFCNAFLTLSWTEEHLMCLLNIGFNFARILDRSLRSICYIMRVHRCERHVYVWRHYSMRRGKTFQRRSIPDGWASSIFECWPDYCWYCIGYLRRRGFTVYEAFWKAEYVLPCAKNFRFVSHHSNLSVLLGPRSRSPRSNLSTLIKANFIKVQLRTLTHIRIPQYQSLHTDSLAPWFSRLLKQIELCLVSSSRPWQPFFC